MICKTDINGIDKDYFDIVDKKDYGVVLRSRCTGHYWYLLEQVYNGHRTFQISHKHHIYDHYHLQKNRPTVEECCLYIAGHDAYHLQKMEMKEKNRLKRFPSSANEKKGMHGRKRDISPHSPESDTYDT